MLTRLTRVLSASYAKVQGYPTISTRVFNDYYKQNKEQMLMHFGELEKIGFSRSGIGKILKQKPDLFKSQKEDLQIKQIAEQFLTKYGQKVIKVLQRRPNVIDNGKLQKLVNILEKQQFSKQQIDRIFENQPQVFTDRLEFRLNQFKDLLINYFNMTQIEALQTISKQPYILKMRSRRITESVRHLLYKKLPLQKVRNILQTNIDILDMGVERLEILFKLPQKWGVKPQKVKQIISANIDYLSQCPFQMMYKKIEIFNNFKIPQRIVKIIFEQYPTVLISSIKSIQAKLNLIGERMKIPLQIGDLFPFLLSKNYNQTLRPRFELLQRAGIELKREHFDVSDEQLCKITSIPIQSLVKQKSRYVITNERDIKLKFYSKTVDKIRERENQ